MGIGMGPDRNDARPLQHRDLQILRKPSKHYSVDFNPEMMLLRSENASFLEIFAIVSTH